MNTLSLLRWCHSEVMGVFGSYLLDDWSCYVVERPWLDNRPNVSCIPEGTYPLVRSTYYRGGYPCWEIKGVPGRSDIKIHKGNTIDDLLGCQAPGMGLGYLNGKWAVISSGLAFDRLMQVTSDWPEENEIAIYRGKGG